MTLNSLCYLRRNAVFVFVWHCRLKHDFLKVTFSTIVFRFILFTLNIYISEDVCWSNDSLFNFSFLHDKWKLFMLKYCSSGCFSRSNHQKSACIYHLSHLSYMPSRLYIPIFHYPNNTI